MVLRVRHDHGNGGHSSMMVIQAVVISNTTACTRYTGCWNHSRSLQSEVLPRASNAHEEFQATLLAHRRTTLQATIF